MCPGPGSGNAGRWGGQACTESPGPALPGSEEGAGSLQGAVPLAVGSWTTATATPRPGWDDAGGTGLGRELGICHRRPGQQEAGTGREQSPSRGWRLEASGGNCRSRSLQALGRKAGPSVGTRSPFPCAQVAPVPGWRGAVRPRERPPEGVHPSTRGTQGSCLHNRPPTSPTRSPGCTRPPHSQKGRCLPCAEHEASRAAAGDRPQEAVGGGGRGRTGGLSDHLLAPNTGPAHGGPATLRAALRATSGPQVPSVG